MTNNFSLPDEVKQIIAGILVILAAVIITLSFFDKAGTAGEFFMKAGHFLIGQSIFAVPLILLLSGIAFLNVKSRLTEERKAIFGPIILSILILVVGFSGILSTFSPELKKGGWIGYVVSWPFLKYFSVLASRIIFLAFLIIGFLILWHFLRPLWLRKREGEGKDACDQKNF